LLPQPPDRPYAGEVRASDDWMETEQGSFSGSLRSTRLGSLRAFRDRFGIGEQRRLDLPAGKILVGTVATPETQARWFGMPVTPDDIAVGLHSIDVIASGPGAFVGVLVDPSALSPSAGGDAAYFMRSPANAQRLRALLEAVFELVALPGATLHASMREAVGAALLALLRRATVDRRVVQRPSFGGRFQAVRACDAYMRSHIDETISLQDLSEISGVRPRSLINAFEAFTGATPMAYLKMQRLNGVRRTLLSTRHTELRIIDIAMDWGFEHMGHFAASYRSMFGERPCETKRAVNRAKNAFASLGVVAAPGLSKRRPHAGLMRLIRSEAATA
jgi:AraC-like DNA-binding protein